MLIDKQNLLGQLDNISSISLDLGCGASKRSDKAIGVDMLDFDCVDIVGDVFEILARIPDRKVDSIYSSHFFEHVSDLQLLVNEVTRVLKPGGVLEVVVPHFSNPYFYSDPTHKTFFGLYTFCYFADCQFLRRRVPQYGVTPTLELQTVNFRFKSSPPFYVRFALKQLVQLLVNMSTYTKELYEDVLSGFIPCYELEFRLRKK